VKNADKQTKFVRKAKLFHLISVAKERYRAMGVEKSKLLLGFVTTDMCWLFEANNIPLRESE